jgi:hypothetical protein
VVSFTLRPFYPWENNPRNPLDRRLAGPQNWRELEAIRVYFTVSERLRKNKKNV